jgi:hypothetical protein
MPSHAPTAASGPSPSSVDSPTPASSNLFNNHPTGLNQLNNQSAAPQGSMTPGTPPPAVSSVQPAQLTDQIPAANQAPNILPTVLNAPSVVPQLINGLLPL